MLLKDGHRKGPCDGVGGVSKRHAEETIKRKQVTVLECAQDYFKWAQDDISSKINYFLVSGNDFRNAKSQIDRWQHYRVPNIMNAMKGPYLYV